ncbi:hypothetical protein HYZ97_01855 [Candidatus Pacearchaeota archaeon]|nr:hypothetical protein [Candidatus Pacearchaeota archaeon]
MVQVNISEKLRDEILKKFKKESKIIFKQMYSLADNPLKGKTIAQVDKILIKEIKYKSFRFYFITNGFLLNIMDKSKLVELLIKFVRMSDKKSQQKVIDEIKNILRSIGEQGF